MVVEERVTSENLVERASNHGKTGCSQRAGSLHAQSQGLERVSKLGGTGDPPVPVGDPPTGIARSGLAKRLSPLAGLAVPVPSGESPDGTGQWPVLPSVIRHSRVTNPPPTRRPRRTFPGCASRDRV